MTGVKLVKGDIVKFKPLEVCMDHMRRGFGGWHDVKMSDIVQELNDKEITLTHVDSSGYVRFEGSGSWVWHVGCFELVKSKTEQEQVEYRERTGYRKFQVGDTIERTRRFTESFQEGEHHVVQRISPCGYYCWVGGHRHKVPMKYFKLIKSIDEKIDLKDIPVPDVDDVQEAAPTLSTFGADECFTKASPDEPVGRVAGDNPTGCGLVAGTEPKPVEDKSELVDNRLVAGLWLDGVDLQMKLFGEWVDIKESLTIRSIRDNKFRLKPKHINFYGVKLPHPVDVDSTQLKQVWGVSFNNKKIFPCAISTARSNKFKGYGMYWTTEQEAKSVLATLISPFEGK